MTIKRYHPTLFKIPSIYVYRALLFTALIYPPFVFFSYDLEAMIWFLWLGAYLILFIAWNWIWSDPITTIELDRDLITVKSFKLNSKKTVHFHEVKEVKFKTNTSSYGRVYKIYLKNGDLFTTVYDSEGTEPFFEWLHSNFVVIDVDLLFLQRAEKLGIRLRKKIRSFFS